MDINVFWIPVTAIVGSFVMVVAIVYFGTRAKERTARYRSDVQMKLIDKFGNSAEFVKFLESPSGRQFIEQPRRLTRDRALGGFTGALICTFIGLAFVGCTLAFRDQGFLVPGFILLGIGIALFISSMISWKMNKPMNGTQQPPAVP